MGCMKSKSSYSPEEKSTNDLNGAPNAASTNGGVTSLACLEKTGMNSRQVFCLKQSWKGIKRKMEDTGVEMFIRLFKTHEGLQSMFQGFKHIQSDDELRSNEALEYHATMVMSTLDYAITHIDNYDFVNNLLGETGASHKRFKDFAPETFLNIKQPFLDAVKVTLGDRYTENMQNIYTITINFLVDTMVEGLKVSLTQDAPAPIAPVLNKTENLNSQAGSDKKSEITATGGAS